MSMYQSASRPEESVTFPCTTASSTMSSSSRSRSGREAPCQGPAPRDEVWGGTGSFSIGSDPTEGQDRGMSTRRTRLLAAAGPLAAAALGGLATDPDGRWFRELDKPAWYPPPQAFGIVWTALYSGIAWAGGEVLAGGGGPPFARAYTANLALNTAWSPLFFRAHRPWAAAAESAVLTASTIDLVRRAGPVSRAAALVLTPYAAWTAFATALTVAIARRN